MTSESSANRPPQTVRDFYTGSQNALRERRFEGAVRLGHAAVDLLSPGEVSFEAANAHLARFDAVHSLYEQTYNKGFLDLATADALAAVSILGKAVSNPLTMRIPSMARNAGIPVYALGKAFEAIGDYQQAETFVRSELREGDRSNRDIFLTAEMSARTAILAEGRDFFNGMSDFRFAVDDITLFEEPSIRREDWLLWANIHMAEAQLDTGRKRPTLNAVDAARAIIDPGNPRFKDRKIRLIEIEDKARFL